jgi:hypothetical protein
MDPARVAPAAAGLGRRRHERIAHEPVAYDITIILLGPQQTGEGLALNVAFIITERAGDGDAVEQVGFVLTLIERGVEGRIDPRAAVLVGQPEPNRLCFTGFDCRTVVQRYFRTDARAIDRPRVRGDDEPVDSVLGVPRWALRAERFTIVGLVIGEEAIARIRIVKEPTLAERRVFEHERLGMVR